MLFLVHVRHDVNIDLIVSKLRNDDVIFISAQSEKDANKLLKEFFHSKVIQNKDMEFSDIFDEPFELPFPFDAYYNGYSSTYFNYSIFHIECNNTYMNVVKYTYEN